MVALVFAEMAGRMPLAGYAYNWNTRLTGPVYGWITGWLALFGHTGGITAVTSTMIPVVEFLIDASFDEETVHRSMLCVIGLIMVFNIFGIRLTSTLNVIAVCAELISLIGLSGALSLDMANVAHADFTLLTNIPKSPQPYWIYFMMTCLLGAWTLVGFEGSADMSEETINARRIAPSAIMASMCSAACRGFPGEVRIRLSGSADPIQQHFMPPAKRSTNSEGCLDDHSTCAAGNSPATILRLGTEGAFVSPQTITMDGGPRINH